MLKMLMLLLKLTKKTYKENNYDRYTWSFPNFETNSENVVKTIHWRYTAVDGEYSASMYGSCAGSEGMDFDAMTKDHAIHVCNRKSF
jgi:hypothetical protein